MNAAATLNFEFADSKVIVTKSRQYNLLRMARLELVA
jgi:hypothetical protein